MRKCVWQGGGGEEKVVRGEGEEKVWIQRGWEGGDEIGGPRPSAD